VETRRLQHFLLLERERNFSRAADRAGLSQPAFSQQIHKLEVEIGAELFDRSVRPAELSETGQRLLPLARAAVDIAESITTLRRATRLGETGSLRIGLVPVALFGLFPEVVRRYRGDYPGVRLTLHQAVNTVLLEDLERRAIDVAVVMSRPADPDVHALRVYDSELVVALPVEHPLAHRTHLRLAELRSEPLIMFPRGAAPDLHDHVIAACVEEGFSPTITTVLGGYGDHIGYVAAGDGCALVPRELDGLRPDSVARVPLAGPGIKLTTWATWREASTPTTLRTFLPYLAD
jgi:DNA-binding transcriptional LysR family regulator